MHHDNGGRIRRALIGAIGLGGAVTIGVVAFGGGAASAGEDCGYYCPSTTVKVTTTVKPTTTTVKPTTTTEAPTTTTTGAPTTTTAGVTTTTVAGVTTTGVAVLGESVTLTPVAVQGATAAQPAAAVAANVAFAG